jgi:hypothetical protein
MSNIYSRVLGVFEHVRDHLNSHVGALADFKTFTFGCLSPTATPAVLVYTDLIKPDPVESNRAQAETIIKVHLVIDPKGVKPDPEGEILQYVDAFMTLWQSDQKLGQSAVMYSDIGEIDVAGGQVGGSMRAEALITLHLHTYES